MGSIVVALAVYAVGMTAWVAYLKLGAHRETKGLVESREERILLEKAEIQARRIHHGIALAKACGDAGKSILFSLQWELARCPDLFGHKLWFEKGPGREGWMP